MKKLIFVFVVVVSFLGIISIQKNPSPNSNNLRSFSVALDWTPNTNHTGIYVAAQKGWYKEQGLDVKILPYSQVSADTLVYSNKADVGISSTENIVSGAAAGGPVISIAAITAHNTSGLIVLEESGINSPRDLDGKIYGGFGLPYEQAVISQVIRSDGGEGEFQNITLEVAAMQALESNKIDFVWVYEGWESLITEQQGLKTRFFPITDYGIPDYYTPNIITGAEQLKNRKDELRKFMKATMKGYEFARTNPKEAAQILIDANPSGTLPNAEIVIKSQEYLSKAYADKNKPWGVQSKEYWTNYPEFMLKNNAVTDSKGEPITELDFEKLYTNEFLKNE